MHSWEDFAFGRKPIEGIALNPNEQFREPRGNLGDKPSCTKNSESVFRLSSSFFAAQRLWRVLKISMKRPPARDPGTAAVSAYPAARALTGRLVRDTHMARGTGRHSHVDVRD